MIFLRSFIVFLISTTLFSCVNKIKNNNTPFSIITNSKKNTFALEDTLKLTLKNKGGCIPKTVNFTLEGIPIKKTTVLKDCKLGVQQIRAIINCEDSTEEISKDIIILNNKPPQLYSYKIINTYPHNRTSYTQGLEFYNNILYESAGLYKQSKLFSTNYKTGSVLKSRPLKDNFFGEGITILKNKIYQLTWKENTIFVYDILTLDILQTVSYKKDKEGWGLCNDGHKLYKSDGSERIEVLNPKSLEAESNIQVYTNKGKIGRLNELEWVNGQIFANIYERDGVAIINPKNGAVIGVVDFSTLKEKVTQHKDLNVFNGIAYNPKTKTIFVTGKNWDKLFEVEIIKE